MKIKFKIFLIFLLFYVLSAGAIFLLISFKIITVNFKDNPLILITSAITVFLIPFIISIIITADISNSLKKIHFFINNFFSEKLSSAETIKKSKRKDEFGKIFNDIYDLRKVYKSYLNFAENLKNGNLNVNLKFDKTETLGSALNDIKENLISADKERKYNLKETELNKWYQTGVSDFTLLLQQDFKKTEEMAYPVIKKLAEHLGAEQIGIFVLKNKNDKEILLLEAAYAYDKKKQLDTEIEIGESLVGKCAKEQKMIRIDDLPEGYTYISSGLGEDTPESLILMPLLYEKKLFGVLEIASLKRISDYRINFLNVIAERIAAEISNINAKILTAKLAEDYKKQSEELEKKEKKSEQKIAELIKEKSILKNEQNKLIENLNLINDTVPTIILNSEGIISDINNAAAETYRLKKNDVLNKNIKEIFPNNKELNETLNNVLQGETRIIKYMQSNETEEIIEKYIPIKNIENEIERIILTTLILKHPNKNDSDN